MLSSLYTSLKRITVGEDGSPESESESRQGQTEADHKTEIPLVGNDGLATNRVSSVPQPDNTTSNGAEKKDEAEKMHATGIITFLDPLMTNGVIERQYFFNIAKFCSNTSVFQRGCKVEFEAKRSNTTWEVTDMKLYESEIEKTNQERRTYKRVIAQVKSVRRDFIEVESGKDNKNNSRTIQIPMQIVKKGKPVIHWKPYDWMQLHFENLWGDDEGTATDLDLPADITRGKITDVAPVQSKIIVGKVTTRHNNFLIDDSIYFTQDVCKSKQLFPVGTTVKCFAIKSTQKVWSDDFVSWRAISVEKSSFMHYTSSDVVMDVNGDEWIDEDSRELLSRHENLLCDKGGISISPKAIKFPLTTIGASTSKTMLISNTNSYIVRMSKISCHQDTSVCTIDFNIPNKEPDGSIQILSKSHVTLDIVCHPLLIGKTTEVCVFEFDGFEIGGTISIIGRSDEENRLTVNNIGIERPEFKKQRGEIDLSTIITDKDRRRVRGSQTIRPPFFSQKRLPLNKVPTEMWTVLKNEDESLLRSNYPNALMQLNYETYKQKFMVSLWFEEMENDLRRRQYDLKRVVLTKCGTGYSFRAPGIQEFTPSVNISDAIDVFDAEDPAKSKFQGTIMQIFDQEVTCVFGDAFNVQYTGYPVTVQFCLGRTNYKRCHFAVQTAFDYLGEQFLFPQPGIIVKSSRICVLEDDEIEHRDSVRLQVVSSSENRESDKPNIVSSASSIFRKPLHSSSMLMSQSTSPAQSSGEVGGKRASSLRSRFGSNTPNSPSCSSPKLEWFNRNLNEEQRDAVRRILRGQARPLPYVIYGPPGTGKTVTLVEAVMQVNKLDKNSRVLVCAPSNAAADIVAENLANSNEYHPGDFVRLNGFLRAGQGIAESISPYCTDGDDLANVAMHRLIVSTCTTSGQFFSLDLSDGHFTHVFIDEAGYCTEPEAMIPSVLLALTKGGQLILAGDPKQLGPVLMSDVAQNCGLNKSFLERLMARPLYSRDIDRFPKEKHNPLVVTKLVKNYRAHPTLLKLPSQLFYNDDLVSEASFEEAHSLSQNPSMKDILVTQGVPLIFHGLQGICSKERDSPSWFNNAEAIQVADYVTRLKRCGLTNEDIGVITPYRKQVEKIRMALTLTHGLGSKDLPKVASVEEFQGGERKVVIISTVRSANEDRLDKHLERLGFLYQPKRFNVVITRAKALMILVGNPHVLARNTYWLQLLRYAIELNAYKGCNLPLKLCPEIRKLVSKDELEPLEKKENPPKKQQQEDDVVE